MHSKRLDVRPVLLEGLTVRLEPAATRHAESLARHGDLETFRYFATGLPATADARGFGEYIDRCLAMPNVVPFVTVLRETGEAIGMTSYLDIRPEHRGLEIGMTWIAAPYRGTKVNPECKLLLLQHAFETLDCARVQLKTDLRNRQSQAAIEKLGAHKEGVLRRHLRMPDGFIRDTVMYSILPEEWPAVRDGLLKRLT